MLRTGLKVDVHVTLLRQTDLFLMRRSGTGYRDGSYGLPSGHLEPDETFLQGAARELKEELGIVVSGEDLQFAHLMFNRSDSDRVAIFFVCRKWTGEIQNMEPHKCDHTGWFDLDALPSNVVPYVLSAVGFINNTVNYSEYGVKNAI